MYGAAECTPPSAHKYSSLWLCTIVAPASMQPSASPTISAGLRGTIGFISFFTTPFSATSMMHGADIQTPQAIDEHRRTVRRRRPFVPLVSGRAAHPKRCAWDSRIRVRRPPYPAPLPHRRCAAGCAWRPFASAREIGLMVWAARLVSVVGQHAKLVTGANIELVEHFVQVIFDRP